MQCPKCGSARLEEASAQEGWVCRACDHRWGEGDEPCWCGSGRLYRDCHLGCDLEEFKKQALTIRFSAAGGVNQVVRLRRQFARLRPEDVAQRLNSGEFQTSLQLGFGTVDVAATGVCVADVIEVDNELEYSDFEVDYDKGSRG